MSDQPDPRDLYAGWTPIDSVANKGVLRRAFGGKTPVWTCDHYHLGRKFPKACAQAELDRRKQAAS